MEKLMEEFGGVIIEGMGAVLALAVVYLCIQNGGILSEMIISCLEGGI